MAESSWWSRLRHDFSRRIEHRGFVLWYLIVERGVKGVLLVVFALYLFRHLDTGLRPVISSLVSDLGLRSGSGFFSRAVYQFLAGLMGFHRRGLEVLAAGALTYGAIESTEAVGLLMRRRWAEYLVVLATAFFIPIELDELARRFTPLRLGALVVNVLVVVYLVWRKRLFRLDETGAA